MTIRTNILFAFALGALALGGCSSSVMIGADDGGADAGARIDGSNGEPCGANVCTDGLVCCNASCGICAPPDAACTTIACPEPVVCDGEVCSEDGAVCCPGCFPGEAFCSGEGGACPPIACTDECTTDADCGPGGECCNECDPSGVGRCAEPGTACPDIGCPPTCGDSICGADEQCCPGGCPGIADNCQPADGMCIVPDCPAPTCDPMQAHGRGECEAELGVRFNGAYCEGVSGCECVGADCGRLYRSMDECQGYHGSCPGGPGCNADLDCPESMYCNGCDRGSCPVCLDCQADCAPLPCGSEPEPACDAPKPECGEGGVAIVRDGCWVCVDPGSCEELAADDCRVTGCSGDQTCRPCRTTWACLGPGVVC